MQRGKSTQRGGKSKPKPMVILDLNNSDNDDDNEGNKGGIMEKERKLIEELQQILSRCQLCGPTKYCKIRRNSQHVALTFNQLRGWALALVCLFSSHLPLPT
jgi:hypothetical protein